MPLACVCVLFLLFVLLGWFLSLGKFVFNHRLTPVVDRPCLALVRQCRKKKRRGQVFFFVRGKSGDGGIETDQGGRLLSEKRDGSGKTGTDLNGRHLLGYAGRGVVEARDEGEGELRTALNGRPRAGVNWGKNGVEGWGRKDLAHQTALNGRPRSAREVVESA